VVVTKVLTNRGDFVVTDHASTCARVADAGMTIAGFRDVAGDRESHPEGLVRPAAGRPTSA